MQEIVVNLHVHTTYSDGSGSHRQIARAALKAGLDAVIVTDHNVWVGGMQRYIRQGSRKLLLLVGEEVHDRSLHPQRGHLLLLGANQELTAVADDAQLLINTAQRAGGLSFIAHPHDPAAPAFHEPDISWHDWSVRHFTGIELWNGMSEQKNLLPTKWHGLFYAFLPSLVPRGPAAASLLQWDELLRDQATVAVGGSDAHSFRRRLGILRRTVYPYDYHFRAVNTHVLIANPLTGDASRDARTIYTGIETGHCYVGYDFPHSTRGFRFSAHGLDSQAVLGDELSLRGGVTLHAQLPDFAEIRLLKDGQPEQVMGNAQSLTYHVAEAGVYRVEAYRRHLGRRRGWIFSNPIYIR